MNTEEILYGRTAYPGFALAPARLFAPFNLVIPRHLVQDAENEIQKWRQAQSLTQTDLEDLKNRAELPEAREILEAHLLMLQDPEWVAAIEDRIRSHNNAAQSVDETSREFIRLLENLDDEYLRDRAKDIKDLCQRVLKKLLSPTGIPTSTESSECILIAKDLLPSEFLTFDRRLIKALIVENASQTSHTAILAKTFEIPMIVSSPHIISKLQNGDWVAVNALRSEIILRPSTESKERILKAVHKQQEEKQALTKWIQQKSISLDGRAFEVASNLSSLVDAQIAYEKGSEGCGLFRTEFLLMEHKHWPSEQEQFLVYKTLVEKMAPHRTVLRLFDIGGDKNLSYFPMPKEENPFLGLRGLRLLLKNEKLLKDQIRAVLRASVFGKIGLMAPMVTTAEEVLEFKKIVRQCQGELLLSGQISSDTHIEIGIMVEVPAVAMILKDIAEELDFISVGTNDLIQYLCATDRMNSEVSHLHDAFNPAILRFLNFIKSQVQESISNKKLWLGMCGELAGLECYIPLLMALGFQELSVSPGALLKTRQIVCQTSVKESQSLLEKALRTKNSQEMKDLLL